ncbi:serine/threonine-protein kinase [Bordetella trematum]|uniref:hypothetical protein n=1 Tax=Bordetella trematum TaxID=123899 RepID=UPI0015C521F3|nr:hypothetical protein [Bordetella trematum]
MSFLAGPSLAGSPFAGAAPLAHRPLNAIAATARGGVPQERIKRLLSELLPALQSLHERGRICGDITTASVGLDESGRAHLMAADAMARQQEVRPPITEAGFAPYEFYLQEAQWPRGPWSDVYSLCAVAHSLICGALPPAAPQRLNGEPYRPLADRELPRYERSFLQAIDAGLAFYPGDRPQSVAALAESLSFSNADETQEETLPPLAFPSAAPRVEMVSVQPVSSRSRRYGLVAALLLVSTAVGAYWWQQLTASEDSVIAASQLAGGLRVTPATTLAEPATTGGQYALRAAPLAGPPVPPAEEAAEAVAEPAAPPAVSPREVLRPAAAPARVTVGVQIQPWGEVWVNGVNRGVSPPLRELRLSPGKYKVVVRNADLPAYHATLEVKPGTPVTLRHQFR